MAIKEPFFKPKHVLGTNFTQDEDDFEDQSSCSNDSGGNLLDPNGGNTSVTSSDSRSEHALRLQKQSLNVDKNTKRTLIMAILVAVVGVAAGAGFLLMGINAANNEVSQSFGRRATDMAKEIESAWAEFETGALWIHASCRHWRTDGFTRDDFEILYNYITLGGLEFFGVEWVPNITHDERPFYEKQGEMIWGDVPGFNYTGFMGQEEDEKSGELAYAPRSEQPFYFPIHFGEPKETIAAISSYDLYSAPWERPSIDKALETYKPTLTGRFKLVGQAANDGYGVIFYHPGAPLPEKFGVKPRDLAAIGVHAKSLLTRAAPSSSESMAMYLFDSTRRTLDPDGEDNSPEFLAGIEVIQDDSGKDTQEINFFEEIFYEDLEDTKLYYERNFQIGDRTWTSVVVPVQGTYEPDLVFIILSGLLIIGAALALAVWMIHNMRTSIKMNRVVIKAAAEAAIVSNLFPEHVRKRMIEDEKAKQEADFLRSQKQKGRDHQAFLNDGKLEGSPNTLFDKLDQISNNQKTNNNHHLTSEGIFGSKPIAQLHPYTTILFADLCGFTAWSSVREPSQVFTLLEILYYGFDSIASRRRVYKVETVGDCYVAVAGLPTPRADHATVMSRFAADCLRRFLKTVKLLERTLGPDTGELGIRIGMHSGQVVAGVLRGDKGRFQLFGDSMNMASRMETTGVRNQIQMSQATADLLLESGREKWVIPREDLTNAKGFGTVQTYFLNISIGSKCSLAELNELPTSTVQDHASGKMSRLIEWNVEILSKLLRNIVAQRQSISPRRSKNKRKSRLLAPPTDGDEHMVLDEVVEIITLPDFQEHSNKQVDPNSIDLDTTVVKQLSNLIKSIAAMYRNNPFHNFEHASHVTMSVVKMMGRIVDPNKVAAAKKQEAKSMSSSNGQHQMEAELHDHTFGINSDPLTQFACAFSAIIHDLDHQGVPNATLVHEGSPLASKYKNKSVAEQNSVDLAWELLMQPQYGQLRACICGNEEEFHRFRSLVVNSVMATDIMDKQLGAARKERWNRAFSDTEGPAEEDEQTQINRKATIVIEHLIQASDISHTMQHWHVYARWNERLFMEMYKAYKTGRLEKDPSVGWVKGELGFFDFYIIPLAKKLFTCGVFGVSSDEFLNYALTNRKEWELKGEDMVKMYLNKYEDQFGGVSAMQEIFDDESMHCTNELEV